MKLRTIHFEGELLPDWAYLLDLAARLCPVTEQTRNWFSRFTRAAGVADARTVWAQAGILKQAIQRHRAWLTAALQKMPGSRRAALILAAWEYSLDTMLQQAASKKTCSWRIDGAKNVDQDDVGGGDITLRRV